MQNQFDPLFQKYGKENNIPFALVKAVAEQESGGNPKAKSNKGAIGLMQLMPLISNTYIPKEDPYNPESNVKGATKFLGHLLQKYNGDQQKALMAYYAGETLVDKYISENKEFPKDIQDYATGVLNRRRKYEKGLGKFTFRKGVSPVISSTTQPTVASAPPSAPPSTPTPTTPTSKSLSRFTFRKGVSPVALTPKDAEEKKVEPVKDSYSITDKLFSFFGSDVSISKDGKIKTTPIIPEEAPNNEEIRELLYNQAIPPKGASKDDVYNLTTDKNIKIIRDYMVARLGADGAFKKDETREQYVKRFLSQMRKVEWNAGLGSVPELNYVYKANLDQLKKIKAAHDLYDSLPDFYEEGGSLSGIPESLMYLFTDPTNLLSFGAGAAIKYKIAREGIKSLIAKRFAAVGTGAVVEGATGAAETGVLIQIDVELEKASRLAQFQTSLIRRGFNENQIKQAVNEKRRELDASKDPELNVTAEDITYATALSAIVGGVGFLAFTKAPKKTSRESYLADLKERKKKVGDIVFAKENRELDRAFDDYMKKEFEDDNLFDIKGKTKIPPPLDRNKVLSGRKFLDEINQTGLSLTDLKVRKELSIKVSKVAREILVTDEMFKSLRQDVIEKRTRMGTALATVLKTMEFTKLDDDVFEGALRRAGITKDDLINILTTTFSESGSILVGIGSLGRGVTKGIELGDPDLKLLLEKAKTADLANAKSIDFYQAPFDFIKRLERESKALVVSSIGTTIRNVYGTSIGLTMDTAAKTLEAGLYYTGRGLRDIITGDVFKARSNAFSGNFSNFVADAFGNLPQLVSVSRTAEEFDAVLADNPRIRNLLLTSLQEVGDRKLTAISRYANTLNIAQDALFRRAIFVQSVKRQLRSIGVNLDDLMANGRKVPMNVIKNASDEALRGTFAFNFKTPVKEGGFEKLGNEFAKSFIEKLEGLPGGSLIIPFPRFIANAMAFQYRYSIFQFGGATGRILDILGQKSLKRNKMLKQGLKEDSAEILEIDRTINALYRDGLLRTSRGMVGLAVMNWAYNHRLENMDKSEFYNLNRSDGGQVDTRAIFPIAPFLAIGDFLAKMKLGRENEITGRDSMQYLETIMGIKLQPDSFRGFLDRLPDLIAGKEGPASERIKQSLGEIFGDFLNRFQQPAKPAYALFDMMNEEAQVARDTRQVEGDSIFTSALKNKVLNAAGETGPLFMGEALGIGTKMDLPEAVPFFDEKPIRRGGELFTQLKGFRVTPAVNRLEQEFRNLGINPYEIQGYKSRGDRKFDMAIRKRALYYLEEMIPPDTFDMKANPGDDKSLYQKWNRDQQQDWLLSRVSKALQLAKRDVEGAYTELAGELDAKREFRSLNKREQRIINKLHAADHEGETLEESGMYTRYRYYLDRYYDPDALPPEERKPAVDR